MFYGKSQTTFTGITDGSSNTIFVSELIVVPDPVAGATSGTHDMHGRYYQGRHEGILFSTNEPPNTTASDRMVYGNPAGSPRVPIVGTANGDPLFVYTRSYHTNGVNSLLGDGSVRVFNSSINPVAFRALGTRASSDLINE